MTEWKNLDTEQPEIGEHVLIYIKYPLYSENFKEVVYCDTSDMPLSFHSIDFSHSWPLIKTWMPLPKPPSHKCQAVEDSGRSNNFYCVSAPGTRYFDLIWIDGSRLLVEYCPFCGEKADD